MKWSCPALFHCWRSAAAPSLSDLEVEVAVRLVSRLWWRSAWVPGNEPGSATNVIGREPRMKLEVLS